MNTSQPRLNLVNASLQLGKGGIKLINSTTNLAVQLSSGALVPVQAADPTISSHLSTKNYVDTVVPAIYNSAGTKLTNVKRIVLQTTTNSSGAWSVTVPNLGQSQVISVSASAISGSAASLPAACIAHVKAASITTVSGLASVGTVITTILIGGSADLVAAPTGTQIYVDLLVQ
jgi:hypothetical protein